MKLIDLTGQKFGKLIVTGIAKRHNGKVYWNCDCECGGSCMSDGHHLRDGRKIHCGCIKPKPPANYNDLTGKRFDMLVVLNRVEKPKHLKKDCVYWLCKCDCGNLHIVSGSNLVTGHTTNCGCVKKQKTSERSLIDLTGTRFGRLVVTGRAENYVSPNGFTNTQWHCDCDCGNKVMVSQSNLRNGDTQSCGCLFREKASERAFEDLTGQRFGRLIVVERVENLYHPSGTFSVQWRCLCDCGNYVIVTSGNLKSGHTISCGCISSKNEMKVGKTLKELKYDYLPQVSFEDCKDVGLLRFDFGIYKNDKLLCLIEYDGEQHYMPVKFGSMTDEEAEQKLLDTQRRDNIKNQYCKNNNIPLLRIPYWDKKNIKKIVTTYLEDLEELAA